MTTINKDVPIIAILRGVTPAEILPICEALLRAEVTQIEVPLNSPQPFDSIAKAVSEFGSDALLGAGTVLSVEDVTRLVEIGAKLIISPNTDVDVIETAAQNDCVVFPGVMTPSEIFTAKKAGATGVKLFPARGLGFGFIKDVKSVLPKDFPVLAVGGVDASNIKTWIDSKADGVGVGSSIYRPGDTPDQVYQKALTLKNALK